jgi:hypothetical protein
MGVANCHSDSGVRAINNTLHGIVKLITELPDFGDEQQRESLPKAQVSSPNHQPRGLAVSQILTELPRHRGPPCGTRSYRQLRDRTSVVY